jgi:hypothetical protein
VDEPDDLPDDLLERFVERLGERVVRFRAAIVCLLFESRWGDATNCSFAFGYRSVWRGRWNDEAETKNAAFAAFQGRLVKTYWCPDVLSSQEVWPDAFSCCRWLASLASTALRSSAHSRS